MQEEFLKYLRSEKRYSTHTLLAYEKDLEHFSAYLNLAYEIDRAQLASTVMIRSWLVSLIESGMSQKTVQRKLSSIKTFFKFLLRQGEIQSNPALTLSPPKASKRLPLFVEEKAMDRLFSTDLFKDNFEGKRDELLVTILYETGIRLSELIGIKISDVDHGREMIKVLGKRNKERFIPVSSIFLDKCLEYLKLREEFVGLAEHFLLVTDKGRKMYPKFVYRKVNQYLRLVTTIQKKSPHILRHTFATHMLNNGADLNVIKEILGHANLAATQIYTHNSIEKLKKIHSTTHPKG